MRVTHKAVFDNLQIRPRLLRTADFLEYRQRFVASSVHREPARTFGDKEQRAKIDDGGCGLYAEHPAPAPLIESQCLGPPEIRLSQRENQVVGKERDRDAEDDVELVK